MIDGRNFHDQPINDIIKQYDKVWKVSTGYGDDYTTDCLLDYAYFKDNYRLITLDLSKQKALDIDPRAIQQILFQGVVGGANNTTIRLCTIRTIKRNNARLFQRNNKSVLTTYKWLNTAKLL